MTLTDKQKIVYDEYRIFIEQCDINDRNTLTDFYSINRLIETIYPDRDSPNILDFCSKSDFRTLKSELENLHQEEMENENMNISSILKTFERFIDARSFMHAMNNSHMESEQKFVNKNIIIFGAPGTGKSHYIKTNYNTTPENSVCVTFHPDTDYSMFVGCYKPCTAENEDGIQEDDQLTYRYVPQAFTNAYVNAWKDTSKPYYLLIEEINRGNCAQIFGDIFQLLDRKPEGESEYSITPDSDLRQYLSKVFKDDSQISSDIKKGKHMRLPKNLYILATMNTSDQSLYPIDSAFKRRWEWKYIPIRDEKKGHRICIDGDIYDWGDFLNIINTRIERVTESEDKQLGYWFVKVGKKKMIDSSTFVSKVIFYLWSDVFKDFGKSGSSPFTIQKGESKEYLKYRSFYRINGSIDHEKVKLFLNNLGLQPYDVDSEEIEDEETNTESVSTSNQRQKIRVIFPDGEGFKDNNVTQTFISTIEKIGVEKVKDLEIIRSHTELIISPTDLNDKPQDLQARYRTSNALSNGDFAFTNLSTKAKFEVLQEIKNKLSLNIKIFLE